MSEREGFYVRGGSCADWYSERDNLIVSTRSFMFPPDSGPSRAPNASFRLVLEESAGACTPVDDNTTTSV